VVITGGGVTALAGIVGLPLLGAALLLLVGKRIGRAAGPLACSTVGIGFVLGLVTLFGLLSEVQEGRRATVRLFDWIVAGNFSVGADLLADQLSIVMVLVITGVGTLIHVYSIGYMHGDPRYSRYFAYLNLFAASMLLLVLADNVLLLYVGWEGVGLCSYLLIGFWFERPAAANAAKKAFLVNRIGDFAFMLGIFLLAATVGSLTVGEINEAAGAMSAGVATTAALLLFAGATGKSAQIPLYVWLPDAMEGPTPVSALIHAATMVTAGVYMVARLSPVFEASGGLALTVVAWIGALTALLAALLASAEYDIKRVLAYSTISQLGYMMAALGVGAYTAGVFHLFTHAFFKALLFLGSGSVIHAVHSNNMSDMGGLRKYMPVTFWTFIIGSLALAGIFPLAGFFSKDEIVGEALRAASEGTRASAWIVFLAAIVTAFLTALYMTRACVKTFLGQYHGHGHPHESPSSMTRPLLALAAATATVGFLGFPVVGVFKNWIFVPGEEHHGFETLYNLVLPVGTLAVAGAAIGLGWLLFYRGRLRLDILASPLAPLYRFVENKYYLDDLYLKGIVGPIQYPVARAMYWIDQHVLDGVVNGSATGTVATSKVMYNQIDQHVVDFAVNGAAGLTGWSGGMLRYVQSGNVQRYAAVLFAAIAVFVALFALT
jgi:NADH-quinone oxidoreductase subunit L